MQKYAILIALAGLANATGDECCTIYSEKNMMGESHDLCFDPDSDNQYDIYTSVYRLSDIDIEWDIASISCGDYGPARSGYSVCLESDSPPDCGDKSYFDGFGWLSYGDNTDLTGVDIPVIGITAQHNGGAVTMYQSDDCTGYSFSNHDLVDTESTFSPIIRNLKHSQTLWTGKSAQTDVQINNLASIRVPSGVAVNLYEEYDAVSEAFDTIYGDDDSCFTFEKGSAKSVKIYSSNVEFATGEWALLSMSSQGEVMEYHMGLESENEQMTNTEKEASLKTSLSVSTKFFFGKTKVSVSGEVAKSVETEVSSTSRMSTDLTYTYKCMPENDSIYGASLYQWQVYNNDVTSFSQVLICRTGENWNSAPQCPPSACKDAICQECGPWMAQY